MTSIRRQSLDVSAFTFALALQLRCASASSNLPITARDTGNDPSHGDTLPPLDLHRTTDIALLPAQICGIVGAYFLTVVVIGICLLTFGRRLRRQAQFGTGLAPEVEMIKSPHRQYEPSPLSPASSTKSWMKNTFGRGRKNSMSTTNSRAGSAPGSPGFDPNHASFDARVLQNNKDRAQQEMEMLYQAVMAHDAQKGSSATDVNAIDPADEEPQYDPQDAAYRPKDKRVLRVATGRHQEIPRDLASPISPYSPGNVGGEGPRSPVRAIYPPESPSLNGPVSPRSPGRVGSGNYSRPAVPQGLPASPRSPRESIASGHSSTSKTRKALRNLRISAPKDAVDDDERTPLTPKTFGDQLASGQPPTPHTGKSYASATTQHTMITEESDDDYENLDKPQPLPRPAPQRSPSHPDNLNAGRSAASSTSTLPLRNQSTMPDVAPTPVKTTFIETRQKGIPRGPMTAGLTPRTGVPMTPYSPYMPYTPITPVTPHLVNKRERKAMQKETRKRVLAKDEGDLVESQEDMFGSAY